MESGIESYALINTRDFAAHIPRGEFIKIVTALKNGEEFVETNDVYDNSPIFIMCRDISSVTVWTRGGQRTWSQVQEEVKRINAVNEEPDWKS